MIQTEMAKPQKSLATTMLLEESSCTINNRNLVVTFNTLKRGYDLMVLDSLTMADI